VKFVFKSGRSWLRSPAFLMLIGQLLLLGALALFLQHQQNPTVQGKQWLFSLLLLGVAVYFGGRFLQIRARVQAKKLAQAPKGEQEDPS
jgi:uncharacterized membrane protein SirB2